LNSQQRPDACFVEWPATSCVTTYKWSQLEHSTVNREDCVLIPLSAIFKPWAALLKQTLSFLPDA